LKIKKVTPAGSLGKKTILKNHLEVDCVYILEHIGYSYMNNFWEVRRAIQDNLPDVENIKMLNHSISFTVDKKIGTVSVDVLPAFEINGTMPILDLRRLYNDNKIVQGSCPPESFFDFCAGSSIKEVYEKVSASVGFGLDFGAFGVGVEKKFSKSTFESTTNQFATVFARQIKEEEYITNVSTQ
jgi:hypothetical protein